MTIAEIEEAEKAVILAAIKEHEDNHGVRLERCGHRTCIALSALLSPIPVVCVPCQALNERRN